MRIYARRRRGTSPSFWREYNNAQTMMTAASMQSQSVHPGFPREAGITEEIAAFESTKRPAAVQFSL
jgi:hypothetical protein